MTTICFYGNFAYQKVLTYACTYVLIEPRLLSRNICTGKRVVLTTVPIDYAITIYYHRSVADA